MQALISDFFRIAIFFCAPSCARIQKQAKNPGVQHLLHLKSKSKILQPIEIMGFFMNFFVKFKEIFCCNCCIFISDVI